MSLTELARKLRPLIEKAVHSLEDADALEGIQLFPKWESGMVYSAGSRVRHGDKLYKVLQDHTSQVGWAPDAAPSLFALVLIPDATVIPDWIQPDSTNGYSVGDRVRFEGAVYESLIDYNVWSPTVYPNGWKKLPEVSV